MYTHTISTTTTRGHRAAHHGSLSLREPLLTLLHVLVEKERHVADDEREHDLREELGCVSQLHVERGAHVHRERSVERGHALWRRGLGVLVEDLDRLEELRDALHVQCGRVQAADGRVSVSVCRPCD